LQNQEKWKTSTIHPKINIANK